MQAKLVQVDLAHTLDVVTLKKAQERCIHTQDLYHLMLICELKFKKV